MDFHLLTVYSIPLDISTCTYIYHLILVHVHIALDISTCILYHLILVHVYIPLDISTYTYTA